MRALFLAVCLLGVACGSQSSGNSPGESQASADSDVARWLAEYSGWTKVNNLVYSDPHWKLGIVLFIEQPEAAMIFARNHQRELVEMQGWAEDEIVDEYGAFEHYPVGAVLAKENHSMDRKGGASSGLQTVTIMVKMPAGYSDRGGDWRYIEVEPDGSVLIDGPGTRKDVQRQCVRCHEPVEHRDFIFHTYLDNEQLKAGLDHE